MEHPADQSDRVRRPQARVSPNNAFSLHFQASEAVDYGLLFYADPNTSSEGCPVAAGWLADDLRRPPPYDVSSWAEFGKSLVQGYTLDKASAGATPLPSGVSLAGGDIVMQSGDPTASSTGAASSGAPLADAGGEGGEVPETHALLGHLLCRSQP